MKTMSIPTDPKSTPTAIVIGGLTDFTSLDEASKWLTDILWDGYAPMPIGTYVKGKDVKFTGIFCANFSSPADRMKSLSVLKSKLMTSGGKIIWADTDLPAKIRAPEQILIALKKQLSAWDFTANSVFADIDSPSKVLKVEGKVVLTVTCDDGQLVCDWVEPWKKWALLQDSAELKTIFDKCKNVLVGGGKGKSKGKPQ